MMSNKLFWKITGVLFFILALLGMGYVFISASISNRYYADVNQQLGWDLAKHLVKETNPFVNGKPDTTATHDIMHSMMVINPSVEVYLLDTSGKIVDFVVANKTVKRKKVDLAPIQTFLSKTEKSYTLGDDPKSLEKQNIFSAAPIIEDGEKTGYAYIILAGEDQAALQSSLSGNYMLTTGSVMFAIMLIGALLIGALLVWYLTKNLRSVIQVFHRFKSGDLNARMADPQKGDLAILGETFNEMADKIVANIDQIKSVEALRRELIANVSHDLRTPLSIMQGYIETLLIKKDAIDQATKAKYLNLVLHSSEKLSKLVAQLFEFSKLESNQIEIEQEPFQLADLTHDVYVDYQLIAKEKNIHLEIHVPRNLPLVFADVALVERVIQNLMDNAVKFTPSGGKVTLNLTETEQGIEMSISDNGPGIPEKEQPYIFERYHRAKHLKTKSEGSGLGLAIVKKILDIHQASIQVKSTLHQGATFMFYLPVYQPGH